MSKNARFEQWCKEDGLSTVAWKNGPYYEPRTQDAWKTWQAAIQSLEVTPELVELARSVRREGRPMEDVLTAVFNAIKEQAK